MVEQKRVDGGSDVLFEVTYKVADPGKGTVRSFVMVARGKDVKDARAFGVEVLEGRFRGSGMSYKITKVLPFVD